MFLRHCKLLIIAIVWTVFAGPSALADGEYQAAIKKAFIDGYAKMQQEMGRPAAAPEHVEQVAVCVTNYVMSDVSAEERKQLDAWATGGPVPETRLVDRTRKRMTEAALTGVCDPPANGS